MDWEKELYPENEKPLDRLVDGYSCTSILRRIAFVGDSLSSGEFETRDQEGKAHYHDLYDYSWGQYIARKNGIFAYNFSKGGMTAKVYLESFAEDRGFWDREKACHAYVIALGVNDVLNKKQEIGTLDDVGTDRDTFLRYYAEIVARYKKISPDAKFFFVTMPRADRPDREEPKRIIAERLSQLAEQVGNAYVIDLNRYGPVYDEKFKRNYYLYGHMNPAGYVLTARLVDSYIDYIIRTHPDDFRRVGFIGTDIKDFGTF